MALQKAFNVQIFDQDGTTELLTLSPDLLEDEPPTFPSRINGGLGECVLNLNLPFDDFDTNAINLMNIVDIYAVDENNPRGRRIYRGFMSQFAPYVDESGKEGVRVTLLGLGSLASASYYGSATDFIVTHTSQDPEVIFKAIVDHLNSVYGGSLFSYSGVTSTVGTSVSKTFTERKWIDALDDVKNLCPDGWWYKIDENGKTYLQDKPATPTHTFTIGKDILSLNAPKTSEKVLNDVIVARAEGTRKQYTDATSQQTYGTGSPATGRRTAIINDSDIADETTSDQRGNKELNDSKDAKIKATLVITDEYDLESIKVGDTCQILNLKYGNTFFTNNMQIVGLEYRGTTVSIELEEAQSGFGRELSSFVSSNSSGGSGSSGGGGGSSGPGFVDREVPIGSINDINTSFTISQSPVADSEMVYLNGVLQNGGGNDYTASGTSIAFVTAPPTGSTLLVSYRTSNGSINFVDREVPSGSIDGSNATFTLAHTPTTGSENLFLNGILQNASGIDYSISGTSIVFTSPPPIGSTILINYRY